MPMSPKFLFKKALGITSTTKSARVLNWFSIFAAEVAEFTSAHTFQLATLLQSNNHGIKSSQGAALRRILSKPHRGSSSS